MMSREEQVKLCEQNMALVVHTIVKYYPTYIYDEDILAEGNIGLWRACTAYDSNKAMFSTFAVRCIQNEINRALRKRKTHPDDDMMSIDNIIPGSDDEGEPLTFSELLEDASANVEESGMRFIEFLKTRSIRDRRVVSLASTGATQEEIANKLGVSQAMVSRRLISVRKDYQKYSTGGM